MSIIFPEVVALEGILFDEKREQVEDQAAYTVPYSATLRYYRSLSLGSQRRMCTQMRTTSSSKNGIPWQSNQSCCLDMVVAAVRISLAMLAYTDHEGDFRSRSCSFTLHLYATQRTMAELIDRRFKIWRVRYAFRIMSTRMVVSECSRKSWLVSARVLYDISCAYLG